MPARPGDAAAPLVARATDALRAAGLPAPRETALRLLAALRDIPVADLLHGGSAAVADEAARLATMVDRLVAGEPFAHVTGRIGFRHLDLLSDARALIPRPETETVVGEALARVATGVAADIGTGTGAIALALKQEGRFERVIAVDLSPEALALARANGERTGLSVEWRLGDQVAPLRMAGDRVDLLVSNPPYLTEEELGTLDPSVRDFEPHLALVSGRDGMTAIGRLLDEGREVIRPGGWLVVEIDSRRAAATAALAVARGWLAVQVLDDLFGRARVLVARRELAG